MTYKLISIDQSISSIGYAIYDIQEQSFGLVQFGRIKLNAKLDYFGRILFLESLLYDLFTGWQISSVVFEQIQLQRNVSPATFKKLAALQFFLQYLFECWGLPYQLVHVSTYRTKWAKQALHLPSGDKQSVFQELNKRLGYPRGLTHDCTDAIVMGLYVGREVLQLPEANIIEGTLCNMSM